MRCILNPTFVPLLCLLVGAGLAQGGEVGRRPVFGRVLSSGGKPVAGATIHLVSNLVPGLPELGGTDEISLVSDERGRFRARLLPGRGYSAWAWWTGKEGRRWTSRVHEAVRPGPALDLSVTTIQPEARLRPLVGPGGERFGKGVYTLGGQNFVLRRVEGLSEGEVDLPRLAGATASLRLYDEQGVPIQAYTLQASRSLTTLTPRARRKVRIRVVFGSEPIQGARILKNPATRWSEQVATSDEQGEVQLSLQGYINKRTQQFRSSREFLILKPGYAATLARVQGKPSAKGELATFDVLLQRGRRVRGRWLDAEGRPVSSMPMALFTNVDRWRNGRTSLSSSPHPLVLHTDAKGRFDLAGVSRQSAWRLMAFPPQAGCPVLVASSSQPPGEDLDLGDLRLQDFVRMDLGVTSAEGRPIRRARLALGEAGSSARDRNAIYAPFWLFPDLRGRARILCRKGLRPAFAAAWQAGMAEQELEHAVGGIRPISLTIRLPRMIHLRGRVRHETLEAFPGAQVRIYLRKAPLGRLKISNLLRTPRPQSLREDGSFDVQVPPGATVMLQVQYREPTARDSRYFYASSPYRTYEEDTGGLLLELKERSNIKRGAVQIGLGVRRQAGGK